MAISKNGTSKRAKRPGAKKAPVNKTGARKPAAAKRGR